MELTDIMPIDKWDALAEELYKLCGMNVRVYNTEGKVITSHKEWANKLCPLIRSSSEGLMTVCAMAQQDVSARAKKLKTPIMSECDAGLIKFVVPIFQGEEFLGTFGACGCRESDVEVEISLLHDITGIDLEELHKTASAVKKITEEEANELLNHFRERLDTALKEA
jgi:ligand-binding sensor protein